MQKRKKAFTLTEILVVIVVLASLSAVAIPQYKKMIEARKTGEAEAVLTAVRTEQERRCAVGKTYTTLDQLSEFVPKTETQNFTYSQSTDGQGLIASSKGDYKYSLKILTYRDGRICCEGDDCGKFNYPKCSEVNAVQAPECTDEDSLPPPPPPVDPCAGLSYPPEIETESVPCGAGFTGNKTRTKKTTFSCVNGNVIANPPQYGAWIDDECAPIASEWVSHEGSCNCSIFTSDYPQGTVSCSYEENDEGERRNYTLTGTLTGCYKMTGTQEDKPCGDLWGGNYTEVTTCTYYYGNPEGVCHSTRENDTCYTIGWVFKGTSDDWDTSSCVGKSAGDLVETNCADSSFFNSHGQVASLSDHGYLTTPTYGETSGCRNEGVTCSYKICKNSEDFTMYNFKCEKADTH